MPPLPKMSRPNLDAALLAELRSGKFSPALFVEADFASGPIYLWTGVGSITWNGHTWTGVGKFGQVSGALETRSVRADNVTISLDAIPGDLLPLALDEIRQG